MPRLPTMADDAVTRFAVASSLTARDRELLAHVTDGRSTGQIAEAMAISPNTVRTRIRRLTRKLDSAATGNAASWLTVAPALTARDGELLAHLVDGDSTAQIAAAMAVSTNTVRGRFRRLARKMDAALAALDGHPVPTDETPGLPPLSEGLLNRPRLLDALTRGVQTTPVTLISGRIGSGKTVLAHCWADAQPADAPPGWLPLGAGDEDPATFWAHADAALNRAGVDHAGPAGEADGQAPSGLAARLRERRPIALVVDNAERLTDRRTTDQLDVLLRESAGHLRLVLCADADPLLPLRAYRRAGTLSEIRGDALEFTGEETRQLLTALGAPVSTRQAAGLQRETGGWAVALRLAAACLQAGADPDGLTDALAGDDGSPVQYLTARMLDDQPPALRRLLLRLSVTRELHPDLVDRLGGADGQRLLATLTRGNGVVERAPGAPGGGRIHPLIRDLLHSELRYQHPRTAAALRWMCTAWHASSDRKPGVVPRPGVAEGR
jgi:LuxR family maltose regulon positive regulatory protein